MSLSSTMTSLMDGARNHFEVTNKLSISNLINLFNPNPNLFSGAKDFSGDWVINPSYHEDSTYKGLKVYKTTNAWNGIYQEYRCKTGKTYTFSFYAKEEGNTNQVLASAFILRPGDNTNPFTSITNTVFMLRPEWRRYAVTFTMNKDYTLCPRIESNSNATSWRCGYKLEEGSLATPLTEVGGVTEPVLIGFVVPRLEVAA